MINLGLAIIDGNLTHDPESRRIKDSKVVTTFSVAINHDYGNKEGNKHVSYIQIETWDRLAENCSMYLKKGSRVTVEGSLRQDRWKDDEGKTQSRVKVIARSVRFDSRPREEEQAA